MVQLILIPPRQIRRADLVASGSPKRAFYRLWIEKQEGRFCVHKESGASGKVLHRQVWCFTSFQTAEGFFLRRIKDKTNPQRHSPRKYSLIS
ncbi:MAG: hypothetical protein HQK60_05030 [Deltaproteobacteria bacterium]|nr:hypothetical protein [Deltaproteobacteria bacterium]